MGSEHSRTRKGAVQSGRAPGSEHSKCGPDALTTLDRTLAGAALLDHPRRQAAPFRGFNLELMNAAAVAAFTKTAAAR